MLDDAAKADLAFPLAVKGPLPHKQADLARPFPRQTSHDQRRRPPRYAIIDADIGRARGRDQVRGDCDDLDPGINQVAHGLAGAGVIDGHDSDAARALIDPLQRRRDGLV